MNRAPKNEYWDFSWNPVTGCLYEGECKKFCHCRPLARRFGKTAAERAFKPALHQERLREPVDRKKPARIFVCLNGDLWGDWVPTDWIVRVLEIVQKTPRHKYIFLTKNPSRYLEFFNLPRNAIYGTTVNRVADLARAEILNRLSIQCVWISFEPLLELIQPEELDRLHISPTWLAIGGFSGTRGIDGRMEVRAAKIFTWAREHKIPTWQKNNLYIPQPKQLPECLLLPQEKETA